MGIDAIGRAAVFLDRDGVLNELVLNPATGRMESPLTVDDLRVAAGAPAALLRLQEAGYRLILVSNQPNYALGKSSLKTLGAIHEKLEAELAAGGVRLARVCYCLHHPKGMRAGYAGMCACRKPSPWFLLRAREELGLSFAESWMIGDQPTDIQCGRTAGVRTIQVGPVPAKRESPPDFAALDVVEAVSIILARRRVASEDRRHHSIPVCG